MVTFFDIQRMLILVSAADCCLPSFTSANYIHWNGSFYPVLLVHFGAWKSKTNIMSTISFVERYNIACNWSVTSKISRRVCPFMALVYFMQLPLSHTLAFYHLL